MPRSPGTSAVSRKYFFRYFMLASAPEILSPCFQTVCISGCGACGARYSRRTNKIRGNSTLVTRKVSICLQAAFCMLILVASGVAQDAISLAGSGSNLVAPLYSAWTSEFAKQHPGVQVTYLPVGTSQSIKTILAGSGDFGGGEIPLSSAQKHDGERPLTQFPTILVAIAPIYKLPDNPQVRFSGELLAEIYLGNVKNWKDPRIAKLNPDITLPNLAITTVHLSGFKGSNYILTDFLSKTSAEWKSKVGRTASPKWPLGIEINRSQGMVA